MWASATPPASSIKDKIGLTFSRDPAISGGFSTSNAGTLLRVFRFRVLP
jgi:hypothetical protein